MEFLGLALSGQVVAASCPATENLENVKACAQNGAGAIILKSASSARLEDNKARRCYLDKTGFWAESGFDREILPLVSAVALTRAARKAINIPLIASATELTLDPASWLEICMALEKAGADALQLDFFYLPNLLSESEFSTKFIRLLREIKSHCKIQVMPKLNIGIPPEFAVYMLGEAGIQYVSLLDSIHTPPPRGTPLSGDSLSVFGSFMLPLTRQYTYILSNAGFSVCAGGGVTNAEQAEDLIALGAKTIQIATEILLNGFARLGEISREIQLSLSVQKSPVDRRPLKAVYTAAKCVDCGKCRVQTFCSAAKNLSLGNETCEGCGLCAALCPNGAINMLH